MATAMPALTFVPAAEGIAEQMLLVLGESLQEPAEPKLKFSRCAPRGAHVVEAKCVAPRMQTALTHISNTWVARCSVDKRIRESRQKYQATCNRYEREWQEHKERIAHSTLKVNGTERTAVVTEEVKPTNMKAMLKQGIKEWVQEFLGDRAPALRDTAFSIDETGAAFAPLWDDCVAFIQAKMAALPQTRKVRKMRFDVVEKGKKKKNQQQQQKTTKKKKKKK